MAGPRRPPRWVWVYDPARAFRQSKKPVPADIQHEVERRAKALIDSTLKPRHIQPPPKKAKFNYLVDLSCKWRGLSLPKTSSGNHQKLFVLHARHLSEQFEVQASCHKKVKFA